MIRNKGITLIALIVTIIILLILAGITITFMLGDNGILNRAKNAGETYEEQAAREKLEIALADLTADKVTDNSYNENEYIDNKLIAQDMIVNGDIVIVDGWEFQIERSVPKIIDNLGKEEAEYVKDGLIVWYDGINNTRQGHNSKTTKWENLAQEEKVYDGELMNVNYSKGSGWTSNSLILDGIDDWVKMNYLHYDNMTIEIVTKQITKKEKYEYYLANMQQGGMGIRTDTKKISSPVYIGSSYSSLNSEKDIEEGKIYSFSIGYNGNEQYLRENEDIYQKTITGEYKKPSNSTIFAIGTNPIGNSTELASTEAIANIEVYSVRIYDHCLTQEEITHNYEIDKIRFQINR